MAFAVKLIACDQAIGLGRGLHEAAARHAQRPEDVVGNVIGEGHTADVFHHLTGEIVCSVAVQGVLARWQDPCRRLVVEKLCVARQVLRRGRQRTDVVQIPVQAGAVGQQVVCGDRLAERLRQSIGYYIPVSARRFPKRIPMLSLPPGRGSPISLTTRCAWIRPLRLTL